jgi:K+-sensing histidine kinase KdpD/ActR/RegA family two-component response regulator
MTTMASENPRYRPLVAAYGAAIGTCALALSLGLVFGFRFVLAALPAAVVVAVWFGGFIPGLVVTLAGSVGAVFYFLRPLHRIQASDSADAASLLLFTLVGLLISLAVRHVRRQAEHEKRARIDAERQLEHTEHLQQLTATLSRAKVPADVMQTSMAELLHAVAAESGAIFLISENGNYGERACSIGDTAGEHLAAPDVFPIETNALVRDAARRRELIVVGSDGAPRLSIGVPMLAGNRTIGVVSLHFTEPRIVNEDTREFLLTAGRHTAQALDRAGLYEAADRARNEAEAFKVQADAELRERQKVEEALRLSETRYRGLAARTNRLYELNAALSEAVTVDDVSKAIVRHGKMVVGASAGSVAMLIAGGSRFETLFGDGYPQVLIESRREFAADTGLCSTAAVETRRPVFVGSFVELQQKYPKSAALAADGGYASAAVLPLVTEGSVFGVMTFHFTVPVNFDPEYKALLTSVAQHCAQALDRARLYETAERARANAEAANQSKDDFLSTISHELRTPLNAILGWAAMLREGAIDPDRSQRAIEAIFNNATRQGRLIEELLDVSRIVAGRASLDLHDVDLGENIRGAVEAMMPQAAAKGVELRYDPVSGVYVVADPRRLEQVFLNLLSNAVKFTPSGGNVTIAVASAAESVEVRVSDTGAGIDAAFLPHVFERFRQADSTTTRGVGGLGLGLFIARQLVDAQEGTIRVESEGAGRGAMFVVTLPATKGAAAGRHPLPSTSAQAAAAVEPMPVLDGIRVLLVDDEPDAREMMASALETCGATVTSAASARDALETLSHGDIDLVLSDIAMPGQDGYELIREIRAMSSSRLAGVPAAAVTAHAREDERERALAAGFQMHLAKPIHPATLAKAVAALAATAPR